MNQTGLIIKVLKEANMDDCIPEKNPQSTVPLGKNEEGTPFDEEWEYAVVVGMLMYLSTSSRPDIAYAVNQCARLTHNPKDSYAIGVRKILRYLKGTCVKGMNIQPTNQYDTHC